MNLLKKILLSLLFFLLSLNLFSQSLIFQNSNYSGSYSLFMNPAALNVSNLYADFSILNTSFSLYNDFAYLKSKDILTFAFSDNHTPPTYTVFGEDYNFMIYENEKNKNLYESLDINLFSFMANINKNNTLGFYYRARLYSSMVDVNWELPLLLAFDSKKSNLKGEFSTYGTNASVLEWSEIALAYSTKLYERYQNRIDMGVTLKYLMGHTAAAVNINELEYGVFQNDTIDVYNIDAEMIYSLPMDYDKPFVEENLLDRSKKKSPGFAFDLGFTYMRKKNDNANEKRFTYYCMMPKQNYYWKLGLSLMDFGFIKFDNNAVWNTFENDTPFTFSKNVLDHIETFDEIAKIFSGLVYQGDSTKCYTADNFVIGLPTTLRMQFDYNVYNNFYLNGTVMQPVKFFKFSVDAMPQIMIEPRYESDFLEFGLPLVLENYRFFSVGAYARLGFITIGTHNLASYLGIGDVSGLDIFVSLKFNLHKGRCFSDKDDACYMSDFGNKKYKNRR